MRGAGEEWVRVGGTLDDVTHAISALISSPGSYTLYSDVGAVPMSGTLSGISVVPRILSRSEALVWNEVSIGFDLGRAAATTVRVYNRAGRLVRTIVEGQVLGPGASLVHWDGRDRDGLMVKDGLYLVTVEALGETGTQALAIVK
jgi:hypothetical protein